MPGTTEQGPGTYSVILFLLTLVLFFSPLAVWWAEQRPPWYMPFVLWLAVTVLSWLLTKRLRHHEI